MHRIATFTASLFLLTSAALAQPASFEGLGDLDGGGFGSNAQGVSADGSVVVGQGVPASGGEAFRWTEEGGMVGLGALPGGILLSQALGASVDGSVIVGFSHSENGQEAFRWENDTMEGLGDLEGGSFTSGAFGASAGGSIVVGQGTSEDGGEAFLWTEESGMVGLGDLPGGSFQSVANAVSAGGSIVVGQGNSDDGNEAFRWTEETGMVGLGDLPGGSFNAAANAVSDDGSVVVGQGNSEEGEEAFIWTEEAGMRSLKDVLENDHGLDLTGWTLSAATGVSADGTVIVGEGENPDGDDEAWRAVVPAPAAFVAGWQLLSMPGSGLAVDSLAGLNLVQGVEGSYPTAAHNLYTGYAGPDYTPATSVEDPLDPGRGFFWYLFEEDNFPGTPPLEWVDPSAFELPVPFGTIVEEDVDVSFDAIPATEAGDLPPFMIGNPFQAVFDVGGVSVDGGTLQTNVFTWDPQEESYITLTPGDSAGVWEGFWAEVDGATAPLTFTLDFESTLAMPVPPPPPPPPFAGGATSFALPLELRGTLDSGEHVADLSNTLRFEEDAMLGWDRHDGSKFVPPPVTTTYALLSPEGIRNGNPFRQSVRSLPGNLDEAVTIPVAFLATEPGSFELSGAAETFPEGWGVTLRDIETGEETSLLDTGYAFTSGTVEDWQDRFEITVTPAGVVGTEDAPLAFRLSNPAPNPATESTALVLRVSESQTVTARVYDALGRQVTTVHDGALAADAEVRLEIDTTGLAAGTYVVRVEGETFAETRRVTVVR